MGKRDAFTHETFRIIRTARRLFVEYLSSERIVRDRLWAVKFDLLFVFVGTGRSRSRRKYTERRIQTARCYR